MSMMSTISGNGSRPTKRRSRAEMDIIREAISELLLDDNPMTVRQVFYQLVGRGVIEKAPSPQSEEPTAKLEEVAL